MFSVRRDWSILCESVITWWITATDLGRTVTEQAVGLCVSGLMDAFGCGLGVGQWEITGEKDPNAPVYHGGGGRLQIMMWKKKNVGL